MLRKAIKVLAHAYYVFQPFSSRSTLPEQLEAVIIEVCMVPARTNPQQVHEAKYLTPANGTYGQAGFHSCQASYLYMKVLVFAEPGHLR